MGIKVCIVLFIVGVLSGVEKTEPQSKLLRSGEALAEPLKLPEPAAAEEEGEEEGEARAKFGTPRFWLFSGISVCLTLFAGLMSGLTVGYLSIEELVLELKIKNGTDTEKYHAERVLKILEKHHLLMTTLLVANSFAMEALPIALNKLVNEVTAVIISVTCVLIFGEVVPQAVCTGPNQLSIANFMAPLTKLMMFLLWPICYPMSKVLDCILGTKAKNRYRNSDLKALVEIHAEQQEKEHEEMMKGKGLDIQQAHLISGAIDLTTVTARQVMQDYSKVITINKNEIITEEMVQKLKSYGFSRYPVHTHDRNEIVGILIVKKLLGLEDFDKTIEELGIKLRTPLVVSPNMALINLLIEFKKGRSHMAIVTNQTAELQKQWGFESKIGDPKAPLDFDELMDNSPIKIEGIITLEDVVEKVLGTEVLDEDDYDKEYRAYMNPPVISSIPHKLSDNREEKRKIIAEALKGKQGPIFIDIHRSGSKTEMKKDNSGLIRSITGVPKNIAARSGPEYPLKTIYENAQDSPSHKMH